MNKKEREAIARKLKNAHKQNTDIPKYTNPPKYTEGPKIQEQDLVMQVPEASAAMKAYKAVYGTKRVLYGPVERSFLEISIISSVICRKQITATDIAKIMIVTKLVRESITHQEDNLVDICGYADILQQLNSLVQRQTQ